MQRIAAIQMNSSAEVGENLRRAEHWITQALSADAAVVVLPENFAFMPRDEGDRINVAEEPGSGPIQDFMAEQARKNGIWLIGGTIPLITRRRDRFFASCLAYDPNGDNVARYDKIHLFDVTLSDTESYRESDYFEAGSAADDNVVGIDTPLGYIGLTICYDLRFPELFRRLSVNGAALFTVPSAFTVTTGRAHWEPLLRSRAIENLAYVVAPAQSGTHASGRQTYGHSMVIDPWGKILDSLDSEREGLVVADIDKAGLGSVRTNFPSLQHRRL